MRQVLLWCGLSGLLCGCVTAQGRGVKTPGEPPTRAEVEACTLRVTGADPYIMTRTFDASGRRVQQVSSTTGREDEPGALVTEYTYDEDGRLSRETLRELPSRAMREEKIYKYDKWGRLVREERTDSSKPGVLIVNEQQFDEFGGLKGRWTYGPSPDNSSSQHLQEIVAYIWSDGNVTEEQHRDPAGGVFHRVIYTYNGGGLRLSREDRFIGEAGERTTRRTRYVWDATGRLSEEELQVLEPDGQEPKRSQRAQYEYDATGRRVRERLDLRADGSFEQIVDYDYGCLSPVPAATVQVGGADEARPQEARVKPKPKPPAAQPAEPATPEEAPEETPAEPPAEQAKPPVGRGDKKDPLPLWEEEREEAPAKKPAKKAPKEPPKEPAKAPVKEPAKAPASEDDAGWED